MACSSCGNKKTPLKTAKNPSWDKKTGLVYGTTDQFKTGTIKKTVRKKK